MLEQKFHFPVKDRSLHYHLGEEKCIKLYKIWIFKFVLPILPKLPISAMSFSNALCDVCVEVIRLISFQLQVVPPIADNFHINLTILYLSTNIKVFHLDAWGKKMLPTMMHLNWLGKMNQVPWTVRTFVLKQLDVLTSHLHLVGGTLVVVMPWPLARIDWPGRMMGRRTLRMPHLVFVKVFQGPIFAPFNV